MTVKQTTSSSAMFGIIFHHLSCSNSLKDLSECNVFLNHLLLSMLGNANILRCSLGMDLLQYSL